MGWLRRVGLGLLAALAAALPVLGWWRERGRRRAAEDALQREREVADRIAEIERRAAARRAERVRAIEAAAAPHDTEARRVETLTDLDELARLMNDR